MPLYEFRCRACGHSFEKLTRLAEANAEQECPQCKEKAAERQLSAPSPQASAGRGGGCAPRGGFG